MQRGAVPQQCINFRHSLSYADSKGEGIAKTQKQFNMTETR
jgi:hypothetical protein